MMLLFHQRASVRVRGAEESGLGTGPRNPKNGNFSSLGLNHVQWDVHTRPRSFWGWQANDGQLEMPPDWSQ